jgi:hypothetical protein
MKNRTTGLMLICLIFCRYSAFSEEIVTKADGTKVILFDDHTWAIQNTADIKKSIDLVKHFKSFLRQGIKASENDYQIACEMYSQGWKYTMPRPKSSQAAWGNNDGRTTWYNGHWYNSKTNLFSETTPQKKDSGLYLGDNQNSSNSWRNGGSPRTPDIYMFLLSESGGPTYK